MGRACVEKRRRSSSSAILSSDLSCRCFLCVERSSPSPHIIASDARYSSHSPHAASERERERGCLLFPPPSSASRPLLSSRESGRANEFISSLKRARITLDWSPVLLFSSRNQVVSRSRESEARATDARGKRELRSTRVERMITGSTRNQGNKGICCRSQDGRLRSLREELCSDSCG